MFKSLRLSGTVLIVVMLAIAFSFSAMLINVSIAEPVKTEEVVLNINGMHCGGCAGK